VDARLLLDIKICESSAILELLARKDEALLVGRNSFFVLNLGLYILNSITRLYLECDRLARQSLDEDLHFITQRPSALRRRQPSCQPRGSMSSCDL